MNKNQRIELRVTAFEKETWAQAAGGPRRVSEWLRALANRATSEGEAATPPPPVVTAPSTKTSTGAKEAGLCPRFMHHRAGVYCGSCQQVN